MGERLYAKIRDFLAENGVTFPNRIDINMSYDQLYKLLRVVNNIEVEVDWVKEDLIENIMEELDRKKIERSKNRVKNKAYAKEVWGVFNKGNIAKDMPFGPDTTRYTTEFLITKTKGGNKSRSKNRSRSKSKRKRHKKTRRR
jgi:hypothetical protein